MFLCSKFEKKDMGEADVILGIKIHRHSEWIVLSQLHYIEKMLRMFNMLEHNGVSTPFDPSVNLCKSKETSESQLDCSSAIGCLMYLINYT